MAEARPLTMRELQGKTPRELEDLAAERGIDFPARALSEDLRQVLAGGGGGQTITTATVPTVGRGGGGGAGVAGASPLLAAAFRDLDEKDYDAIVGDVAAPVLNRLSVDQLKALATDFDVDVTRSQGDGDPVKEDYVEQLADAVDAGVGPASSSAFASAEVENNQGPEPSEAAKATIAEAEAEAGRGGGTVTTDDGLDELTKPALQELAQRNDVEFKSRTKADELRAALREKSVRAPGG